MYFFDYGEETIYDTNGCYSYVNWYKEEGYRILEWSDYMSTENEKEQAVQEFTKADLKYGYLVELRNREKVLYMPFEDGDIFDFCNGFQCLNLKCYSNNLLYNKDRRIKDFDVMRVYGYTNIPEKTTQLTTGHRKLIWERKHFDES
ncbi:MAG: hypothetical protein ACLUJV_02180 [Blautia producta]|nr:hypothetical protein [uncultured Blautia sp.]